MAQIESHKILAWIYGKGRGSVFTPKDLQTLASNDNLRITLRRLTVEGKIRRLLRGVYEYPEFSRLLNAPASPDPDAIARAIARAHGWTILPEGNTALNLLGLSTQVPAQWQYFSDGPTKSIHWSGGVIAFKHRANKETTGLSPETALLVQALKTLGEDHVDGTVLCTLRERMSEKAFARAAREARYATSWVYEIIKRLAEKKEATHA